MSPPAELLAWHWTGGLLLGAYGQPDHVPDAVVDDRLRRVVEAIIAIRAVDGVWPVDVGAVADVLEHLGVYDEIGGDAFLLDLMETWSERTERARVLGEREAQARIALAFLRDELAAEDDLFQASRRREQARTKANEALAALDAAREAA